MRPRPRLTIGCAVYDDYNGAYFSLQALRMYHDLREVELIVIDNKPDSADSPMLKDLISKIQASTRGVRYIAAPEVTGTAAPRNRIFEEAEGEAVVCMDSHVLLTPSGVARLIQWYAEHPDSQDLVSGPLIYDDMVQLSTHFQDVWNAEMWGIWGSAWQHPNGKQFSVSNVDKMTEFITLTMNPQPIHAIDNKPVPKIPFAGHEKVLVSMGYKRLGYDPSDEFEVPGQGLGLFSCRKEAWLGFNPQFREFGGEEMYIHEKFRQAGHRCLCLGFLKWLHRFGRPGGVQYPIHPYSKARNYVIGHNELGLPLDRIKKHFVPKAFPETLWDSLVENPSRIRVMSKPTSQQPATVEQAYQQVLTTKRDLEEHLPKLRSLAMIAPRITEFSKRRESLIAFAAAQPESIVSYNMEKLDSLLQQVVKQSKSVKMVEAVDSTSIETIEDTDLLFIDSRHTFAAVREELKKFAPNVHRYIVLHDTYLHAMRGEDNGPGLMPALREFVNENPMWFVHSHTNQQYGLTVLGCQDQDKPAKPLIIWPPGFGPGTELKKILASIGVNPSPSCDCNGKAVQMDFWGVDECKRRRDEIVGWMKEGQTRWGWVDKIKAAANAVTTGLAFKLNALDPFPGIIHEAISNAEIEVAKKAKEKETNAA